MFGYGYGFGKQRGGGSETLITPTLPQSANIVRAYSLRRLIDAYKKGVAIISKTQEVGGETQNSYLKTGLIDISGADARIAALYDQMGGGDSKRLIQSTYSLTPAVYLSGALRKGMTWETQSTSTNLQIANPDTTVESAFAGSFTLCCWFYLAANGTKTIFRRAKASAGGGSGNWLIYTGTNSILMQIANSSAVTFGSCAYAGSWSCVVLVIDRVANSYKMYFNGQPHATTSTIPTASAGSDISMTIGGSLAAGVEAINDIALWNIALTDSQVSDAYNAMQPYYIDVAVR